MEVDRPIDFDNSKNEAKFGEGEVRVCRAVNVILRSANFKYKGTQISF
jgi:hypothetical protein